MQNLMDSHPLPCLCGFAIGGLGLTLAEVSDERMALVLALLLVTAAAILLGAALAAAVSQG